MSYLRRRICIEINSVEYCISFQGSKHHYCEPKEDLECLAHYVDLEVAIFEFHATASEVAEVLSKDAARHAGFPKFITDKAHYEDGPTFFAYVNVALLMLWRKDVADHLNKAVVDLVF